jgi:TRAP-type C4-dicarboxylate transport system permease small subunit
MILVSALSAITLTWILRDVLASLGLARGMWGWVEAALGLFLMLGMLYAAALQVTIRYALADVITVPWTEEFSRLLLVWAAFWGALLTQRTDEHISVTIVFNLLPPPAQRAVLIFGDLMTLGFLAVVVWYGWQAAQLQHAIATITLGLPVAAFAYVIPVAGVLLVGYTVRLLILRLQGKPVARPLVQEV